MNLLAVAVAALFFFVVWKSAAVSLTLSPQNIVKTKAIIYESVEFVSGGSAGIIDQASWFIFGFFGLYLHIVNKDRAVLVWAKAWPLLIVLALIILSIFWSSVPDIALRRVVKQMLLIAAAAGVVMGATSPREILRLAVLFTGLIMAMNFAAVLVFPAVAITSAGDLQGLFGHKNIAGVFAMVAVFVWFAAARWSRGAWTRGVLFSGTLLWFLFLLGTSSRTSIICTILAILFIIPVQYCLRRPLVGVVIALCTLFLSLCAIFALILLNVSFSDIIAFVEAEKTTLTGRVMVWQTAYEAYLDHKLLGTGYGSLWLVGRTTAAERYSDLQLTDFMLGLTQAHNGYLDILATLGIVGAIAFFVFLVSIVWINIRALVSSDEDEDHRLIAELSGFIVLGSLVYNLTQSTFLVSNIFWVFLVICYLMLCSIRSPTYRESYSEREQDSTPASRLKS